MCLPTTPEIAATAYGPSDCLGTAQAPQGSWTVTLTSVTPYADPIEPNRLHRWTVHGSFSGTLYGGPADAGQSAVALSLQF